jgi:CHAT domain-containing protein
MARYLTLVAVSLSTAAAGAQTTTAPNTPFEVNDDFLVDSRDHYVQQGPLEWTSGKIELSRGSALGRQAVLLPRFTWTVHLTPQVEAAEINATQLHLVASNGWEIIVMIRRAIREGRIVRQAAVTHMNRSGNDPTALPTELMQTSAFVIGDNLERWDFTYDWGVVSLACNGNKLGTGYSGAFSSWVRAAMVGQGNGKAALSHYQLNGRWAGYTATQRAVYEQSQRLRAEAEQLWAAGDLEGSIARESKAIPLIEQGFGKDDFSLGLVHNSIATRYEDAERRADARRHRIAAITVFEKQLGKFHPELLYTRVQKASLAAQMGWFDEAEAELREVEPELHRIAGPKSDQAKSASDHLASLLARQATECLRADDYAQCEKLHRERVEVMQRYAKPGGWDLDRARREHALIARLAAARGSEQYRWRELVKASYRANDPETQLDQAEWSRQTRKAIELAAKELGDDDLLVADLVCSLGSCEANRGNLAEAFALLERSVAVHRRAQPVDQQSLVTALVALGGVLSQMDRWAEADETLREAAIICRDAGETNQPIYAGVEVMLGRNFINWGKPKEAAVPLREGLAIYMNRRLAASSDALTARERLADICRAQGDLAGAEQYLQQQRYIVERVYGRHTWPYVQLVMSEARRHLMRSEFPAAVTKYQEAQSLAAANFGRQSAQYKTALEGLVEAHAYNNDAPAAIKSLHELFDHERLRREMLFGMYPERLQFDQSLKDQASLGRLLHLVAEGLIPAEDAYRHVLALKGAVTEQQRMTLSAAREPELKALVEELTAVNSQLIPAAVHASTSGDAARLAALHKKRDALQSDLARRSTAFRRASMPASVAELRAALPPDAALVDFVEYWRPPGSISRFFGGKGVMEFVAFVTTRDTPTEMVRIGPVKGITDGIANWRNAMIQELLPSDEPEQAAALADQRGEWVRYMVWRPLEPLVGDAQLVILSADGALGLCPFAALPEGDDKTLLVENRAVVNVFSPVAILSHERLPNMEASDPKLLLVGDLQYDADDNADDESDDESPADVASAAKAFTQLPEGKSSRESLVASARKAFPTPHITEITGSDATEQAVSTAAAQARFLHFDTHGFCIPFDWLLGETPSDETVADDVLVVGGIALSGANRAVEQFDQDGVLWVDEIASLDLRQAELVVLSACQSAEGRWEPGEGVLGAQRALYVAGAQSSLATLWPVLVEPSRQLTGAFYRNLWERKLSKAEALRQAQLTLVHGKPNLEGANDDEVNAASSGDAKASATRRPPIEWAGFVLYGDWR